MVAYTNAGVLKFESSNKNTLKHMFQKVVQGISDDKEVHGSFVGDALGKLGIHYTPDKQGIIDAIEAGVKTISNGPSSETNEVSNVQQPAFCHDLNCPQFTVIEDHKEYQLREYVASSWVTTSMNGVDYDTAGSRMFMKLFGYISGKNDKKETITMTCPVIVRVIPGQGPTCENNFTMSFFNIPNVTPPKPSEEDVYLSDLPKLRAYVRTFGGFASMKDWISEADQLAKALSADAKYVTDFFYTGGYDAPFKLFNRHNEVWFIAE